MKNNTYSIGSFGALAVAAVLLFGNASGALAATNFTRNLTLGSSGADVSALQSLLASQGFSIPSGPTGYFGAQTKAALAAYQAAHGITPAAGYFGTLTRSAVNGAASTGSTDGTSTGTPSIGNPSTPSTTNSGREASLKNFNLISEESSVHEGEKGVKIATAEFDVKNADVRIQRIEIRAVGQNTVLNAQPWKYIDHISVLSNGKQIASKDVSSRNAWSEDGDDAYTLSLSGLSANVRSGDKAELTIVADIASSIDSSNQDQIFDFSIDDRGIRVLDAAGIQQYTGEDNDLVSLTFSPEENGDLVIRNAKEDPDTTILVSDKNKESNDYKVFVFNLNNKDDVDALVREVTISVTDLNSGVQTADVIRRANLTLDGKTYSGKISGNTLSFKKMKASVDGDSNETGVLSVTLARNATSTPIGFALASADITAEGVTSGDDAEVSGGQASQVHLIASKGIEVSSKSASQSTYTSASEIDSAYGMYTLKFTVAGLKDDVYIATTSAMTSASEAAGVTYSIEGSDFAGSANVSLSSSAKEQDGFYRVSAGKTETFTLSVALNPSTSGLYAVRVNSVRFNDLASFDGSAVYTMANGSGYKTDPVYIPS